MIKPTLDRVLVKKCNFEEVYNSNIILLTSSKDDINKFIFEVVDVGPGGIINGNEVIMHVKKGDKVIIPEYIGSEINIKNDSYRIVKQDEILAIIED